MEHPDSGALESRLKRVERKLLFLILGWLLSVLAVVAFGLWAHNTLEHRAKLVTDRVTSLKAKVQSLSDDLDKTKSDVSSVRHLVGTLNNGQFVLLASDVRGTVQADSDGSSRIASPFGARAREPDSAAEVDYADSAFDADIGGVRMGVRDYDPRTARFLQPDPLYLGDPERCVNSPVDCGLYTYARSSPATYVDPTGNEPETTESASAAERVANASRGAAHTAEHLAKHDGEKLVRQGYQFLMKSTEQFGEHSEAWYKGAHEFFEWGEHVAKRGEALGHKIEIAGAVLSGLDKAHETLKEHPGQYGRAARNGAVAGGVDLGLGLGVPALLVAVACPECAVGYGILYVGDGIYGAIKGHNATSALTNGIIHRIDRATERKSIAPRVPEHGAATIPTPPHH